MSVSAVFLAKNVFFVKTKKYMYTKKQNKMTKIYKIRLTKHNSYGIIGEQNFFNIILRVSLDFAYDGFMQKSWEISRLRCDEC